MGEKPAENGVTVAVSPARKTLPSKRAFGTELTNIDINRSKLDSTVQKKAKLAQGGGDILNTRQANKSGFVYGPFHPSCARKQEPDDCKNAEQRSAQDWESLADSFRPHYQNQGRYLSALLLHCSVSSQKFWCSKL
jgi:hypothetical protein